MAEEIEYEQLDPTASSGPLDGEVDLRRISGIPMELSVEIGRTYMTVGETLSLRAGSIVALDRFAGEPVDLLVNGTPIAQGEVVVVDDKFGLRISQIIEDGDSGEPADEIDADAGSKPTATGESGGFAPAEE